MNQPHPLVVAEETIGKYQLIGVLAEGGMARLCLAEQSGPQGFRKVVALKRVLPHLAGHPEFRRMFLNEAIVAARLDHPNIVTTYELGEVDGQYFISMEYLAGEDLAAVRARTSRSGPMPIAIAASIAQQCASALAYAHEFVGSDGAKMCIVHRDVNPANIIVTYHGGVKLLDFGIVKIRGGDNETRSQSFKGKLSYAAPEQLAAEQLDGRADIFCLGIVLWESLTGQRLFDGPSEAARLEAVRTRTFVAPSVLRQGIPPELDAIVLKALARDRNQRFQRASEFAEALDVFLGPQRRNTTDRAVGTWLETLFGAERASVKRSVAQGHDLAGNLASLHRMLAKDRDQRTHREESSGGSLRSAWSTDLAGGPSIRSAQVIELARREQTDEERISNVRPLADDPSERPAASPFRSLALVIPVLLAISGWIVFSSSGGDEPVHARPKVGTLEVVSDPPGAQIVLNGEPTGMLTPTTLRGLPLNDELELRVEKVNYRSTPRKLRLLSEEMETQTITLEPSFGVLRILGGSGAAGEAIYIDDRRVDVAQPIELAIGEHSLRVELGERLIVAKSIRVVSGVQTIELGL